MFSAKRNAIYNLCLFSVICLACVEASGVFNFNYGVSKYIVKYDPSSKEVETIEPRYEGDLNTIRITPSLTNGRFSNSTGIIQLFKDVKYTAKNYLLTVLDFDNNVFNVTITISCEDLSVLEEPVRYLSVGDYPSYQFIPGFHYKIPLRMSGIAKSCVVSKEIGGFSLDTKYYEGEMVISNVIESQQLTFYCVNGKSETNKVSFNISSLNTMPLDSFHGLKVNEWKWINKDTDMSCGLINPNNNHYTKITERYIVESLIQGEETDYKNGRSYNGYIKIDETNKYSFRITTESGSGAYLRVNRNYVIQGCPVTVDGIYESKTTIDLNKGIHEIEVFYYNMNGISKNLTLEWKKTTEADYKVIDKSYFYISPNTILSYDREIISVNSDEKNVIIKPIIYDENIKIVKYMSKPSMKSIGLTIDEITGVISGNISSVSGNEKEYSITGILADGKEISCIVHINIMNNDKKVLFNIVEVEEISKTHQVDEKNAKADEEIEVKIDTTLAKGINRIIYNHYDIVDNGKITIKAENAEDIKVYNNKNELVIIPELTTEPPEGEAAKRKIADVNEGDEEGDEVIISNTDEEEITPNTDGGDVIITTTPEDVIITTTPGDEMITTTPTTTTTTTTTIQPPKQPEFIIDLKNHLITINACVNYKIDAVLNNNHYYLYLQCEENEDVVCVDKSKKLNITSDNDTDITAAITNGIYFHPTTATKARNLTYCVPSDLFINLIFESNNETKSVNIEVDNTTVAKISTIPSTYLLDIRSGIVDPLCSDIYGVKSIKMPTEDYRLIPLCIPSKTITDCTILPNTNSFTCDVKSGIIKTTSKTSQPLDHYTITLKYIDNNEEHTVSSVIEIELSNEVDDYYPLRDLKLPINMGNFINGKYSEIELIMSGNAKECVGENLPYGMSLRLVNGIYSIVGNAVFLDSNNYTMNIKCRNDLSESYNVNYTYYVLNEYARGIRSLLYNDDGKEVKDTVLQIANDGTITLPVNVTRGMLYTYLNLEEGNYKIELTNNSADYNVDNVVYMINDKVYKGGEEVFIFQYSSLAIEFEMKKTEIKGRLLQQKKDEKTIKLEITNKDKGEAISFNSNSLVCNPKEVDTSTVDVRYDGNIFRFPVLTYTTIKPINTDEELNRIVDCIIINSVNVSSRIEINKNCEVNISSAELGSYTLIIQPYTMVKECKRVEITIEIRSCNEEEPNMVEYTLQKKEKEKDNVAYIISPNHVIVAKLTDSDNDKVVKGMKCLPNGVYKTKGIVKLKVNGYKFTEGLYTIEESNGKDIIIGENQIIYYTLDTPSNKEWYLPSVNVKDWDNVLGNETIITEKNDLYIKTDYNLQSQNNPISSFVVDIDNKYKCSIYVNGIKLYEQETVETDYKNIKVVPPNEILHLNGVNTIGIEYHTNTTGKKLYFPNLKITKYDNYNGDCMDITAILTNTYKKMNVNTNITDVIEVKEEKDTKTTSPEKADLSKLFRNDVDSDDYKGITFNSSTPVSLLISYSDVVRVPISNFGFKEIKMDDKKEITSITGVVIYGYVNDNDLKESNGKLLLSDMSIPVYPLNTSYFTNFSLSITATSYKYYNITFYHDNSYNFTLNRIFFKYCLPITCPGFDVYNTSSILDNYNISSEYYEDDFKLQCNDKRWGITKTKQIEPIKDFKYDFDEYTVSPRIIPFSILPSYKGVIRELKCECDDNESSNVVFDGKTGRISALSTKSNVDVKYTTLRIKEKDGNTILQNITINIVLDKEFEGCIGENVWPNTKVGERVKIQCVDGKVGYRYRKCLTGNKWSEIDNTNCRNIDSNENKTYVKFEYNVTVSTANTDFETLFDKIRSELLFQWRLSLLNNTKLEFPSPNIEDIKIEYIHPEIRQLSTIVQLKITLFVEITPTTERNEIESDYKSALDLALSKMKITNDNKDRIFSDYVFSSLTESLYSPVSLTYCKELKPYYNETCQQSSEKWTINQFEDFILTPEDNMYYHYNKYDNIQYSIVYKPNEKKDRKVIIDQESGKITIDSSLPGGNNLTIIASTSNGKEEYILNYEVVEKKCPKDGYWNATDIGKTISKNCTDGYIGLEYRQCNDDGEWNDVDRDSCVYSNIQTKPSKGDDVIIKIEITYSSNPVKPERILRELEDKLTFEDWEVRDAYKRKLSELSGIDINDISIESVTGNSFVLVIKANDRNNAELSKKVTELVNDGSIINAMKNEDIRYSDLETNATGVKYETVDGTFDEPIYREEVDNSLKDGALAAVIIVSILGVIVLALIVFIGVKCFMDVKKIKPQK